jgi:DNA polymerase I - 3''-5'' exonuclease and polymerase domains
MNNLVKLEPFLYPEHYNAIIQIKKMQFKVLGVLPIFQVFSGSICLVCYENGSNCYKVNGKESKSLLEDKNILKVFWNQETVRELLKKGFAVNYYITIHTMAIIASNCSITDKDLILLIRKYCGRYYNLSLPKSIIRIQHPIKSLISYKKITKGIIDCYIRLIQIIDSKHLMAILLREIKVQPTIDCIEVTGIKIDVQAWNKKILSLEEQLSFLEQDIKRLFPVDINVNSPEQLKIGLSMLDIHIKDTTDITLKKLCNYHPIIEKICHYRKKKKVLSTYGTEFLKKVDKDGRIRTSWNNMGTKTFRITCHNPNLQGISTEMRQFCIANEGCSLISGDYKNIELFILAYYCKDKELMKAFENNMDVHKLTASAIYGVKIEEVTEQQRKVGKKVAFGLCYGMGVKMLQQELNTSGISITLKDAEHFKERFFNIYQGISDYRNDLFTTPIIKSLGGRIWMGNDMPDSMPQRFAYPIQTSCAEALKETLILIGESLPEDWKVVNVIHDEIILETKDEDVEQAKKYLEAIMIQGMKKIITTGTAKVDLHIGKYWSKN